DSFNVETTSLGKVRRLEEGMPDHRATFTVSQSWDDISMFVRANYFGKYYASHADDTSEWGSEVADSAFTIDAEVTYTINDSFAVTAGANNLFDQEAHKLNDQAYSVLGAIYYESGPFDYNGAFYYAKLTYSY
ncbi:MAG: TonB-dependent receptor, partial [Gammaproteobacteria bacterium]|nr:TonB-dependent receptor [Gammaproteobacteria bacterium]